MTTSLKAADLEKAVRDLIAAQETNLGVELTMPVAFGDGELVTVVVEATVDGFVVHDAGFSAMRLSTAGINFTQHVAHRLHELAQRYRCAFVEGRVTAQATIETMPQVVSLVANASRAVADYVYEIRRQVDYDFRLAVFDKLRAIAGDRIRETDEFRGKSGRLYRVPILLDATRAKPQNFVSTLAHRHNVPQSFAMLYDLGRAYPEVELDAIYDDTADIRQEDRSLLTSAGAQVFGWMEAERRFKEFVRNAKRH
jgi:hypothetical protein